MIYLYLIASVIGLTFAITEDWRWSAVAWTAAALIQTFRLMGRDGLL